MMMLSIFLSNIPIWIDMTDKKINSVLYYHLYVILVNNNHHVLKKKYRYKDPNYPISISSLNNSNFSLSCPSLFMGNQNIVTSYNFVFGLHHTVIGQGPDQDFSFALII